MGRAAYRPIAGVYFIQGEITRLIKVGFSTNVAGRYAELRGSSPDLLTLLGVIPGNMQTEIALHAQFGRQCVRREWFSESPELLATAAAGADLALAIAEELRGRWKPNRIALGRSERAEEPITPFAARVTAWRQAKGLTFSQAETHLQASGGSVRSWEHADCCPVPSVAARLATEWGITVEELLAIPGATTETRKALRKAAWWRKYGAPRAAAVAQEGRA